ncbi:MAG: high-potential iron-sulfur protein [Pseudomonadota bacterium]
MARTLIGGMSRRTFLGATARAAACALGAGPARAQTLPKRAVAYQTVPRGSERCDNCTFWLPRGDPADPGGCSVVQGEVLPEAWCTIWARAA